MRLPALQGAYDLFNAASLGLRSQRLGALLSSLGIGIGVASVVGVLGISQAQAAAVRDQVGHLSNLVEVTPGSSLRGGTTELPAYAPAMITEVTHVQEVTSVAGISNLTARPADKPAASATRAVSVVAARTNLLDVLGGSVSAGVFLNAATERYPTAVLGAVAAQRLGVGLLGERLWIGMRWFTVIGILNQFSDNQELDSAALIGFPEAEQDYHYSGAPTTIYVRTDPGNIDQVLNALPASANPSDPMAVQLRRPSLALQARATTWTVGTQLFVALGAVSLLVGGAAMTSVMLTAVRKRRTEIGLRRSLGATRLEIALQFLAEAVLLSGLGGLAGALAGVLVTALFTQLATLPFALPPVAAALGVAVLTGAVAGFYPALRAARLAPSEALRSV